MLVIHFIENNIFAKSVYKHTTHIVSKLYAYSCLLSLIHSKSRLGVFSHIKAFEIILAVPGCFFNANMHHLINTVMLKLMIPVIISNHVIILIIPHKHPRTYNEPDTSMPWNKLLIDIPLIIFKPYFFILIYCTMYIIHIVIYAFIHGLNTVINEYLTLQLLCLMLTHELLYLCYKFP